MPRGRFMIRISRWLARRLHGLAARFERLGAGPASGPLPAPPDPRLLILAERYPGAPEHWLRAIAAHLGTAAAPQGTAPADEFRRREPRPSQHWPEPAHPTPPVLAAQTGSGDASRAMPRPRLAVPARSSPRRGGLPAIVSPAPGPIGRIAQRLFGGGAAASPRGTPQESPQPIFASNDDLGSAPVASLRDAESARHRQPLEWLGGEPMARPDFVALAPHVAVDRAPTPDLWPELPPGAEQSFAVSEAAVTGRGRQRFVPIGREPAMTRYETFGPADRLPWPALPPSELGPADAEPLPPDEARFRHEQMVSRWSA